jgi:RNA polymerase sigma-70 factor (ECF subfamily)
VTDEPFEILLEQLRSGDVGAAERLFAAHEPILRIVVRRRLPRWLRAKYDSTDVVQSVWAGLMQGLYDGRWRFVSAARLRAFLITAVRNRLTDRVRQHHAAANRERPMGDLAIDALPPDKGPRPSETLGADELWERMLALSPPAHHELLRLRRQGLTVQEIAARTGFHVGSVRRVLRELARRIAGAVAPPS